MNKVSLKITLTMTTKKVEFFTSVKYSCHKYD